MAPKRVFQFRISLKYIKPEIWRRVLIPGDYSFKDLHFAIVSVMGWSDLHLHKFSLKDPQSNREIEISSQNYGFDELWFPETEKIAKFFTSPKQKANYEYDFGSTWYHIIIFENAFPAVEGKKYPQCIDGRRATPPEDPPEDYLDYEHDTESFSPDRIRFYNCRDFQLDVKNNKSEAQLSLSATKINEQYRSINGSPSYSCVESDHNVLLEEEDEIAESSSGPVDILNVSTKRKIKEESSSDEDIQEVQFKRNQIPACLSENEIQSNSEIYKSKHIKNESSILSLLESDIDEDIEDVYGKYIATQMRLVADLETRENLRLEINNCIKKFRFNKK